MPKFVTGDRVHIGDLGPNYIAHSHDVDATVVSTYRQQFGCGSDTEYTLNIDGRGLCSWYPEAALTVISQADV